MTAAPLPEAAGVFCFLLILMVPCAGAGIALINTGLCRSRNSAHSVLSSLCVAAVAALAYFAVGFSWQGYPGEASRALVIGGRTAA